MIKIYINDEALAVPAKASLEAVLMAQSGLQEPYAVALNHCFIPHTKYAQTVLQAGDRVDILQPMQGG